MLISISGLCLLEKESEYKSQAIGYHNGAQHLGIFQISDRWWCKWDREYNIGCGVKCHNFLDEDLKAKICLTGSKTRHIRHICPYQLGNKCSKETILNIWRNEKYFSILLIYQLFGYN